MKKLKYVVTCSKCLQSMGFTNKKAAMKQLREWEREYPRRPSDSEAPPYLMTWDEWVEAAKESEFDPYEALDNA